MIYNETLNRSRKCSKLHLPFLQNVSVLYKYKNIYVYKMFQSQYEYGIERNANELFNCK